nr:MAG TPA: hypothetical protein [Caudoviricetes sp.]
MQFSRFRLNDLVFRCVVLPEDLIRGRGLTPVDPLAIA